MFNYRCVKLTKIKDTLVFFSKLANFKITVFYCYLSKWNCFRLIFHSLLLNIHYLLLLMKKDQAVLYGVETRLKKCL